jgi:hypothetical protein
MPGRRGPWRRWRRRREEEGKDVVEMVSVTTFWWFDMHAREARLLAARQPSALIPQRVDISARNGTTQRHASPPSQVERSAARKCNRPGNDDHRPAPVAVAPLAVSARYLSSALSVGADILCLSSTLSRHPDTEPAPATPAASTPPTVITQPIHPMPPQIGSRT